MCDCEPAPTATLDELVRRHAADSITPGDVVVSWVTLAGVRHVDGGGYVVTLCSDDLPPIWQMRGLLAEAEAGISRAQLVSEMDDQTEE